MKILLFGGTTEGRLLAGRADVVIRVCCGLPQVLKGEWTC